MVGIEVGITAIVTLGITYIKSYFEHQKSKLQTKEKERLQDIKLKEQNDILLNSIQSVSEKIISLEDKLDFHINENDFVREFRDIIRERANQILSLSFSLDSKYKNILKYWTHIIEKFGIDFYNNKNRKNDKKTLEKYLVQDIEILLEDFNNYVDVFEIAKKSFKNKPYSLSLFIEENKIHNKTHLLVARLIENGLSKKDIINLFTKYIDSFFELFLITISSWNALENYNFAEKKSA